MKKSLVSGNAPIAKSLTALMRAFAVTLLFTLPFAGHSQNPVSPSGNIPAPVVVPNNKTSGQQTGSADKKPKEPAKPAPGVVPAGGVVVPSTADSAVSAEVLRFFDKKKDGFYIKSMAVLFLDKAEGTVYVTDMKTFAKYSKSMTGGGSGSSSALQRAAKNAMASLKKEPNTARVTSSCWKDDPANTLFHGKGVLSAGRVCKTGCDLNVTY